MNDSVAIALGIIGAAAAAAVLVLVILVTLDRWTARSKWEG